MVGRGARQTKSSPRFRGEGDHAKHGGGALTKRDRIQRARQLRREMSPSELALWELLRGRPNGFQFRRQPLIGPFYPDFYCRPAGMIIEVDGDSHDMGDRPQRDGRRDRWFAALGIETLRIPAVEIHQDVGAVVEFIVRHCEERAPPPSCGRSPSPRNRGEDKGTFGSGCAVGTSPGRSSRARSPSPRNRGEDKETPSPRNR
ncbi:MAG: endonuclease domain-containing protein [Sphingosinicella sp.]